MWVQIVITILGLIVLGISIPLIFWFYRRGKSIDIIPNSPIIENPCRTEFTSGYYSGILKNIDLCKNNCYRIEYYPIDITQRENMINPVYQCVIVKRDYVKFYSWGELSSRRNIIRLIHKDPLKYPEKMRNSTEGKEMTIEGQKAWLTDTFGISMQNSAEAIKELMRQSSSVGITKDVLKSKKEIEETLRKINSIPKEENTENK